MILWLTRSVWEFTSLTRLASTSTQTISKGLFDLAVRNFKRNHAPRLRYRAQASPLLRDAEVVRPVHEHVYAIELLAEKRPELKERLPVVTGREPPSPRAGRYAGHQQNGERARDEDLRQAAGHRFGHR